VYFVTRKLSVSLCPFSCRFNLEDGANLFQHYGDFASIQGDAINAVNAILESLAVQADIVSGCPDKC
jgi:hypothetical protein